MQASTAEMRVKVPVLTALVAGFERAGPLSVLHSIYVKRQRVRVMVRYVDCIRGTLTGYLLAFDKHMNMILRDVDEVFSARVTRAYAGMGLSKPELEYQRRICLQRGQDFKNRLNNYSNDSPMKMKRRYCPQLLVRGDCVVMVHRADTERSPWSKTRFATRTINRDNKHTETNKIGTPRDSNLATSHHQNHSNHRT